jgi:hypothetical protein
VQHPSQPIKPVVDSNCESSGDTILEGTTGGLQRQNGKSSTTKSIFHFLL